MIDSVSSDVNNHILKGVTPIFGRRQLGLKPICEKGELAPKPFGMMETIPYMSTNTPEHVNILANTDNRVI